MKFKDAFAYTVLLPVFLPIILIDHAGEKLIEVSSCLEDIIGKPYQDFWQDAFKAVDITVNGEDNGKKETS